MAYAKQMLDRYPRDYHLDGDLLAAAIEALGDAAQATTGCADACLSEGDLPGLDKCIRLCLDCADVATAASRVLSRQTEYDAAVTLAVLQAAVQVAASCADECESHATHHSHCQLSAEAARTAAEAAQAVQNAIEEPAASSG